MLSLRGASYRYPGAKRDTLHGVDLDLLEGTVTGLVGPAEAGKSTLCLVAGGLAPRVVGGRLTGRSASMARQSPAGPCTSWRRRWSPLCRIPPGS